MHHTSSLSRREFLKVAGVHLVGAAVPLHIVTPHEEKSHLSRILWPSLRPEQIPYQALRILHHISSTYIDPQGYLVSKAPDGKSLERIPLATTLWNQENSETYDRLDQKKPWAIVLHWYGDKEGFDDTVKGYLRGFDSLRKVGDYTTRTSAHFLVSDSPLSTGEVHPEAEPPGILQTQKPAGNGIPYVASHIQNVYYGGERSSDQYFSRALYQLGYQQPGLDSLLHDFVENPRIDPNTQTIAIEIAGWAFDKEGHFPGDLAIANTLSLVWALLRRYKISPLNILGHHEIQLSKPDPGKKFLALIRYLVGVKALQDEDPEMKLAVFGPFLHRNTTPEEAVKSYFKFIRDYLSLVAPQRSVYEWESMSGFWLLFDRLTGPDRPFPLAGRFCLPLESAALFSERLYLQPEPHEGLDLSEHLSLVPKQNGYQPVRLLANGECLAISEVPGACRGKTTVFCHRQEDGAEILSVYSHLEQFGDLKIGGRYPDGFPVGHVRHDYYHSGSYLHMALAFGATWDLNPKDVFVPPEYAGAIWVRDRFTDPAAYLSRHVTGHHLQYLDGNTPAKYPR